MEPSPSAIKKAVEESSSFVDWFTDVLRGRNPVKKLLLLDAILIVFLNPLLLSSFLERLTYNPITWYPYVFWPTLGVIFIAAVVAAIRVKAREVESGPAPNERSAIKGLLPFAKDDAKLFSRLQREDSLRECLTVLTSTDFRFGMLCGESGCGKSSFLQAGLWPRLLERGHSCLYVKLTALDPLDSIRLALVEQFKLPTEVVADADLLSLLENAAQTTGQPAILLFDQFEQFFVHRKREKQRKPFVDALAAWYRKQPPLSCRILICLREDFAGRLVELQKPMGYSLGPQQSFRLDKFEPEKAARIFRVIAETENASFDETFVDEFTQQELASRDDGLVSPVDIQLIAWMIAAQSVQEGRAFNRASFQKIGGLEGLLETFLKRALEARETDSRRQAAIKVLLALTDLDGNARAGVLTIDALQEKLAGTVGSREVEEAVAWLTRSDVRLVNTIDEGHELAHERLIPALRRVAGATLSIVDQANQLFERRVNEWLGNNRGARYLLTWREWRLIENQRPYLVWGQKKSAKEALLKQSKGRWRLRFAIVAVPLIIASLGVLSYQVWRRSEAGQINQIKTDLLSLGEGVNEKEELDVVVESFVFSDMTTQAFQVVDGVKDLKSKDRLLKAAAIAFVKLNQSPESVKFALVTTGRISDDDFKAETLSNIVQLMVTVGKTKQSPELLGHALEIASSIPRNDDDFSRKSTIADSLSSVAVAFAQTASQKQLPDLLNRAFAIARTIDDADAKRAALSAIAVAMTSVSFDQRAELYDQVVGVTEISNYGNVDEVLHFGHFVDAVSKQNDQTAAELLNRALEFVAGKMGGTVSQAMALSKLAAANSEKDPKLSSSLLDKAIAGATEITDQSARTVALATIAEQQITTDPKRAVELFKAAGEAAKEIPEEDSGNDAEEFANVPKSIARIAIENRSFELFAHAIALVGSDGERLEIVQLVTIDRTVGGTEPRINGTPEVFKQTLKLAESIERPSYRAEALSMLARFSVDPDSELAAKLLNEVFEIVRQQKNDAELSRFIYNDLVKTLVQMDLARYPKISDQALQFTNGLESHGAQAEVIAALAEATAPSNLQRSLELFDQAVKTQKAGKNPGDLTDIVKGLTRAAEVTHSTALLDTALSVGQNVTDSTSRPEVLVTIAETAVRLKQLKLAREVALMNYDNENKAKSLAVVLRTWAELRNPSLAEWNKKDL